RKPWKMPCTFRKRSTARFPPCWRKRQRLLTLSSTSREGESSSAAGLPLYRERSPALGHLGDARSRGLHRASAAGGGVTGKHRSADPVAEPRSSVAGGVVARAAGAPGSVRVARSRPRLDAVFPAGNSRCSGLELFLLPRDSADERGNGHHPAIHGSSLGVALYGAARSKAAVIAKGRGGGVGRRRLRAGRRLCWRGRLPHGRDRSHGCVAGCLFFCVLQRRRTPSAGTLRPLESPAVGVGGDFNLLDLRKPAMENCCRSLRPPAVGIHAGVFLGFRTR